MKSPDGKTVPIWKENLSALSHPEPPASLHTQVCVVGAGIAGLTTAYLLAKEGKQVVVLDEGPVGAGQTERTSAHLASAIDDRFYAIEQTHGEVAAKLAYESHASAIDMIGQIAKEEQIDCDFARLDAYLFLAEGDEPETIDREFEAAKRVGFRGVTKVGNVKLPGREKGPGIRFPHQAKFQPVKYVYGLARAAEKLGVKIYVGKRVNDVTGADSKKQQPAKVTLDGGAEVLADAVVVATNTPAPINDWFGIYTKQASYRTYVVGIEIPADAIEDALFWDTGRSYHYVRLYGNDRQSNRAVLLVGGEDHKTGQGSPDASRFDKLVAWARDHFAAHGEVVSKWSGQVQESIDGLGFIGHALTAHEQVYVITGDSGMGLTHGTLGARLVTDQIQGRSNPWEKLYDPGRRVVNVDFVSENANTMAQFVDYVTPGEVKSVDDIVKGEGALMREGLKKIACYKDDSGRVHRLSSACTHLGCIVNWNQVEKSWDCPCHGSRFDPTGRVVMGPAITDLSEV